MRYAHQYGRGTELSPFFYVDDKRTYFVEPLPDAPLPRLTVPRPTAGFALRATTTAPPASATNAVNTTHYQQTINNQIIDRGITSVTIGSDQLADLGDILADEPPPAVVFEHSTVTTTGFRYQFTRFYHPYTCTCLKQLSRHGVDGLLNPDPALDADSAEPVPAADAARNLRLRGHLRAGFTVDAGELRRRRARRADRFQPPVRRTARTTGSCSSTSRCSSPAS